MAAKVILHILPRQAENVWKADLNSFQLDFPSLHFVINETLVLWVCFILIGNEVVHTLTSMENYTIRFDMWTVDDLYVYAMYDNFELLSESEGYRLKVSGEL